MKKEIIYDYLGLTLGSVLTAMGLVIFLVPNKIAAGGISGLSTVLHYLFDLPVGLTMLIINTPIFIMGVKVLGSKVGIRTLYSTLVLSLATDYLPPFLPLLTHDSLLAAIYGGVLAGMGLGVVFRFKGTTGGTDLIAQLIRYYTNLSVGKALLVIDFLIIALAAIVFGAELALYALVALFITSKVIDLIQEGFNVSKGAFIISDQAGEIKEIILHNLDRGVTVLEGKGGYTDANKAVLLCVISRSEVVKLKNLVSDLDDQAFVIITDVHEVLGEGFTDNSTL
ncbi:MAG: YitT family protein [Bacillota bacterium]